MHSHLNTTKTLFKRIYQLAKDKNEAALASLIEKGLCVGQFDGAFNNIMLLAKEGDWESAEFLINKFDANTNHLLFGAAWGDHIKIIKRYLAQENTSINSIVKGAACCGNTLLIDELLDKGASLHYAVEGAALGSHESIVLDLVERGAKIDFAVRGAACAGNIELTDILLEKKASIAYATEGAASGGQIILLDKLIEQAERIGELEHIKIMESAILGASFNGNLNLTNKLIQEANDLGRFIVSEADMPDIGYFDAIYGAASGGHTTLVNAFLTLTISQKKNRYLNCALIAAGTEGHSQLIYNLIANNSEITHLLINFAAMGAAVGGNIKLVYELIEKGAILTYAAVGAMLGQQLALLNNICRMGKIDFGKVVMQAKTSHYLKTRDRLRFMSFIDDSNLRSALAEQMRTKMSDADVNLLLNQATKLNYLMREYELPFYQAQVYLKLVADKSISWILLQGHRYISDNRLPFELYLKLIKHMIGPMEKTLKNGDMECIYQTAHKRLRDRIILSSTTGFFALFKKKTELNRIKEEANQRYQERLRY